MELGWSARVALWSLREHPRDDTPAAIAAGPGAVDGLDAELIAAGLAELAIAGLVHEASGHWQLTPSGSRVDRTGDAA